MTTTLVDWTTTRADRRELRSCTYCEAGPGVLCAADRPQFCHVGRRWSVGITQPGMSMSRDAETGGDLIALTTQCSPTVEHLNDAARPDSSYRAACLATGCGWVGVGRNDENPAVEDAHDHSHPGWRDLPVITAPPHDMNNTRRDEWRREINRIYTGLDQRAHLLVPGGVIRTDRRPNGTRSHWSHPVGGYDICAGTDTAPNPPAQRTVIEAPTLF
jgi:hypothetical protein